MNALFRQSSNKRMLLAGLSRTWDTATKAASGLIEAWATATARQVERITNIDLGGFTDTERLDRARQRLEIFQNTMKDFRFGGIAAQQGISNLSMEIQRLDANLSKVQIDNAVARYALFTLAADDATRAIFPQIEAIDEAD